MREGDSEVHPKAAARQRTDRVKMIAGLVIAAAGLVAVFAFHEVYVGFVVALVGAGIVPVDKIPELLRK